MGYEEDQQEKKDLWVEIRNQSAHRKEQEQLPRELTIPTVCPTCSRQRSQQDFINTRSSKKLHKNCKWCRSLSKKVTNSRDIDVLYANFKRHVDGRGLQFTLTISEFASFYQQPCFYCSSPILSYGLDRIDSSLGYVSGNVASCCPACNQMKNAMGINDFLNQVARIYHNLKMEEILKYQSDISLPAIKNHKRVD